MRKPLIPSSVSGHAAVKVDGNVDARLKQAGWAVIGLAVDTNPDRSLGVRVNIGHVRRQRARGYDESTRDIVGGELLDDSTRPIVGVHDGGVLGVGVGRSFGELGLVAVNNVVTGLEATGLLAAASSSGRRCR